MNEVPFDLPRALIACAGSAAVYDDATPLEVLFPRCKVDFIFSGLATAAVVQATDCQYVFHKGTNPEKIRDWLTDLNAGLVADPYAPGKLHRGLFVSASSVFDQVKAKLSKDCPVAGGGHSKGAAESSITLEWLARDGFKVMPAYDFGAPRHRNHASASSCQVPRYRIVHEDDIVPHLPPGVPFIPPCTLQVAMYKHCGTFCHLRPDGTLAIGEGPWDQLKDDLASDARGELPIQAHSIEQYHSALLALQASVAVVHS
jgi:hypothetical protein